jgi:protein-L-isoaspartate(D-aspartate) O-methyltransferase
MATFDILCLDPRRLGRIVWRTALALLVFARGSFAPACQSEETYSRLRKAMVERQIAGRGITDRGVLEAMSSIPRHLFVPPLYRSQAYEDYPLPIEEGQTISQPYIVALMTQCLSLHRGDKVLEIGTGSGYQAAVLARLANGVFSIEINENLSRWAGELLDRLGLDNVRLKSGDGFFGWPEEAPFDAIIVTCAAEKVPEPLFDQLAEGGRLIIPLGPTSTYQVLTLITKKNGKARVREVLDVRFVPMTGEIQRIKRFPEGVELLFSRVCANFLNK